jgi:hypothetical protein
MPLAVAEWQSFLSPPREREEGGGGEGGGGERETQGERGTQGEGGARARPGGGGGGRGLRHSEARVRDGLRDSAGDSDSEGNLTHDEAQILGAAQMRE